MKKCKIAIFASEGELESKKNLQSQYDSHSIKRIPITCKYLLYE